MSISTIRACACGLRTRVAPEHPGGLEVARVGELAGHLRHGVGASDASPTRPERSVVVAVVLIDRPPADRVEDLLVAGAAAEVAGERLADLVVASGSGCASSRSAVGDDEPGRAEAALHGAGVDERLLHRVQRAVAAPSPSTVTTSCPSACAARTRHEQTSVAVEEHRARAALALLAGVLRAGQAEPLAQREEQALAGPDVGLARARR